MMHGTADRLREALAHHLRFCEFPYYYVPTSRSARDNEAGWCGSNSRDEG
jgi:hypothetical protein